VSLDKRLLQRIDRAARERGLSRSAYLAELAERDLDLARGPGATRQARAALQRLDRMFAGHPLGDAVEAIRAERDARS
jgi:metal-responsive CopG/Arc/MetJ family transcriptional regulator